MKEMTLRVVLFEDRLERPESDKCFSPFDIHETKS